MTALKTAAVVGWLVVAAGFVAWVLANPSPSSGDVTPGFTTPPVVVTIPRSVP